MELRMTNQREMILRELKKSKKHLTADELYERVKKIMPRISLATVYRNLETLSDVKMIRKLEISGRQKRFDSELEDHDHIYCVQCHRVENLDIGETSVNLAAVDMKGYTVTGRRLEVTGTCPKCQKKQMQKTQKKNTGENAMACGCKTDALSDEQKQVLEAMNNCDGPCAAKDIAAATGLESKQVSCRITALKKKGYVDSPVRCKYGITSEGKTALKA
jgi:Fe2+ or Zn2+ uptake regulation protein